VTPERGKGRLRVWLGRLVMIGISLVLTFVVAEVGFRLWESFVSRGAGDWAVHDPDLLYKTRPLALGTNQDGLFDDPVETPKQRFRVLMLGDSIPFYGDDWGDTYVGRLERRLAEDASVTSAEVINAGIKGYTNYQQMVYLEKYGVAFEPDLVGVSFCLNDLHKFAHFFQFDEEGNPTGRSYDFTDEAVQAVESPLYRLARKSHLLVFLRRRLAIMGGIVEMTQGGFTFDHRPDFVTAWQEEPWKDVETQLGKMADLGRQHGFPVFVVVFPFADQLREDYLELDREYVTKPQRKLAEICGRLGIPLLDLFEDLDPELHMMEDRIHLTAEGRAVAAERVASFLVDSDLVPAAAPDRKPE
jgi:lysophospholipase L1-like esterase